MTDEELSKCLEIEADRDCLKIENERLRAERAEQYIQLNDAANQFDAMAQRIMRWPAYGDHLKDQHAAAADCRTMAHKLRGET